MGTKTRYVSAGDNLSGKTLHFDFSNWRHNYASSSSGEYNHIYADSTHRIYSTYHNGGSLTWSYEALFLQDGSTTTRIGTLREDGQSSTNTQTLTLSSSFGMLTSVRTNEVYYGVKVEIPSYIYVNGTAAYNVYFNGTNVSEVYLNGTKIF